MSENQKVIEIEVLRYHPEKDKEPHKQVFEVPFTDDMSVLQGVQYIKDYLDGSLSFRWSCRMAICGSCGMMINGEPSLSCQTFLRDYYPARVRVEALSHFPIERDLVINMEGFIEKLESIQPYIIPKEPRTLAQGEYLQTRQASQRQSNSRFIMTEFHSKNSCQRLGSGTLTASAQPHLWAFAAMKV